MIRIPRFGPRRRLIASLTYLDGVDVELGVGLVEDGDLGPEHGHLEDLDPLFLAAREALVDVAREE